MTGNCYFFAVILTHVFPCLSIAYLPVPGHFVAITPSGREYYDALGKHLLTEDVAYYIWTELVDEDASLYRRIQCDCCS